MKYKVRTEGIYTVLEFTGDVDLACSPDARKQMLQCLEDGRPLLVDLSAVHHIDSSGVAVLVEGHITAAKKGLHFGIAAPSRAVMDVLRLARLDGILTLHGSGQ